MWYYLIVRRLRNMVLVFMVWIVFWADVSLLVFFAMLSVWVESPEKELFFCLEEDTTVGRRGGRTGGPSLLTTRKDYWSRKFGWTMTMKDQMLTLCHKTLSHYESMKPPWKNLEDYRKLAAYIYHIDAWMDSKLSVFNITFMILF